MACHIPKTKEKMPNIVLIMADDMGVECLSCNGALSYSTPNLDRLAQHGINFRMCFSQPLCTPSRVKIMTGKYNYRNYKDFAYLDVNEPTFGNMLKKAGYKTAVAGKWQLNGVKEWSNWENMDRPVEFGFDEYCLWQLTYRGNRYPKPYMEQNGEVLSTTMDDYGPDISCNYLLDFMERNHDVPFFAYYPMILVHNPFRPTPDSPEWKDTSRRMDSDNRYFKDMVEYTDKIVGRIDEKLSELGIRDNTLLIFLGDNGTNSAIITSTADGPYAGGKGNTTDAGIHVPMVVSWPAKINEGFETDYLVGFSDFFPTFADAAGIEKPENIDGKSFCPLLTGDDYMPRKTIFVHHDPKMKLWGIMRAGRFVRTNTHKLYHDGRFYNLEQDPLENHPLETGRLTEEEKIIYNDLKKELDTAPEWVYVDENYKGDLKQK
ncbi:hypothetical protein ES708_19463 [subsurface metagenome]